MPNYKRFVYIPIPKVRRWTRTTTPDDQLQGHEREEARALYDQKSGEIEQAGENLLSRFASKDGKQGLGYSKVMRHGEPTAKLDITAAYGNAVLYVHCHGNSQVVGLRPFSLSAAELAARLEQDRLPKANTPIIKLWSCHSGEAVPNQETFVKQFATALKARGYTKFLAIGYLGTLTTFVVGEEHKMSDYQGSQQRAQTRQVRERVENDAFV